jgi:NNP family nitrate/nitrite transporter-like MFS transporter
MGIENKIFNLNDYATKKDMARALIISTLSFTVCFSIWTIFSIIGIKIKQDLLLNDTQFAILIATPILTGSISRIFLGMWSDKYGGKIMFTIIIFIVSIFTWLLAFAENYMQCILISLGIGLAGGTFAIGVSYISKWYPKEKQGTVLGIFGVGNLGAAITNFIMPFLLSLGWQYVIKIYAIFLFFLSIFFYLFGKDDPSILYRRRFKLSYKKMNNNLKNLLNMQVLRFSLYYFFVFGSFIALSLWLPRYYIGVYGLDIKTAGILTTLFSLPASVFRVFGGVLSDKFGARKILYNTFIFSSICLFIMSYPSTNYIIQGVSGDINISLKINIVPFVILTIILGFFMSLGMAAVYKHISIYYHENVGTVGGIVGLSGGLGGFFCPIIFGILNDIIGIWTSCYMFLFIISMFSLICMHISIIKKNRKNVKNKRHL